MHFRSERIMKSLALKTIVLVCILIAANRLVYAAQTTDITITVLDGRSGKPMVRRTVIAFATDAIRRRIDQISKTYSFLYGRLLQTVTAKEYFI